MRRLLGTLLTAVVLLLAAGCGSSSSSGEAVDGGPPPPSASGSPVGPVTGVHVLPLVSITGVVGGRASAVALPLGTTSQVDAFVQQFGARAQQRVRVALEHAQRTAGAGLYGAVVAVGCDRPPGVTVSQDGSGHILLEPKPVASPLPECVAPVTTIALVALPR
jgi:hypothetical protein